MPKISTMTEQYRHAIGNYTYQQDKKNGGQRQQDEQIKLLASRPGRYSGNNNRHQLAHSLVQLISMLNIVSSTTANTSEVLANHNIQSVTPSGVSGTEQHSTLVPEKGRVHGLVLTNITSVSVTIPKSAEALKVKLHTIKAGKKRSLNSFPKNNNVIQFLSKKEILEGNNKTCPVSKEKMVAGVAHWLSDREFDEDVIPQHKMECIARCILRDVGDYGGKDHEVLSRQQIAMVVRNWAFNLFLGASLNAYLTRKIATAGHPGQFTVNSIKSLASLETLCRNNKINMENIPPEWRKDLEYMWGGFLQKEIPFILLNEPQKDGVLLNSPTFSHLYTGTRFLSDLEILHKFSYLECLEVGEALWNMALRDGVYIDKMPYFVLPALFSSADERPEIVRAEKEFYSISADALNRYIEDMKKNDVTRLRLVKYMQNYQSAVNKWANKGRLAEQIISDCPTWALSTFPDKADIIRTPQQKREKAKKMTKQMYMNGIMKPCESAPESLGEEYKRLTKNVSDSFYEIDKQLLGIAFENMEYDDFDFLFLKDSIIHPVSFNMKTNNIPIVAYNHVHYNDLYVNLKNTDLFSVILDEQERIYALKWLSEDNIGKYEVTRVDRDIHKYISADVFDHQDFGKNRVVDGGKLKTDKYIFQFTILSDKKVFLAKGGDKNELINAISAIHRENIYRLLYAAGDEASDIQKLWTYVKHIIPFYDCIEGIIDNNPVQAVPSCMVDAVSMVPVFSQTIKVGRVFNAGLSSGLHDAGIILQRGEKLAAAQALIKHISVPTVREIALLGKGALSIVDPGFELISGIGKEFVKRFITLLNKDKKTVALAEKLISTGVRERLPTPPDSVVSLHIENSEVNIPMDKIGKIHKQDIYALVSPDTGYLAGKRFQLTFQGQLIQSNNDFLIMDLPLRHNIPKMKNSYVMYHIPWKQPELGEIPYHVIPEGNNFDNIVEVLPLPHFLSLRFDNVNINRVDLDFHLYKEKALLEYYPDRWQEIIAAGNEDEYVYLHCLSDKAETIPDKFKSLKKYLWYFNFEVSYAKKMVKTLRDEMNLIYFSDVNSAANDASGRIINDYLEEVLINDTPEVIGNALERLKYYLDRICDYFDNYSDNIYIATGKGIGTTNTEIPGPMGFTTCIDTNKRMVILADRFFCHRELNNLAHLTVLHESSHVEGGTRDFFSSPYTTQIDEVENIYAALEDMLTGLDQTNILYFDDDFLDSYARQVGIQRPSITQFKQIILNDDMLRANIIIDNADSLVNIIDNLYKRLFSHRETRDLKRQSGQPNLEKDMIKKVFLSLALGEVKSGSVS